MDQKLVMSIGKAVFHFAKDHAALILTIGAAVGVVATSVETARATVKAKDAVDALKEQREYWKEQSGIDQPEITKEEIVKECWKLYIPSAIIGTATVSCIVATCILTHREQKNLAAAYAMVDQGYKLYRKKIVEKFGESVDRQVSNEVIVEQASEDDLDTGEKLVCYDPFADRYFETTRVNIERAINYVNRELQITEYASLNDFYRALGISETEEGSALGWNLSEIMEWLGYPWLDFSFEPCNMGNNQVCYSIEATYPPFLDYLP